MRRPTHEMYEMSKEERVRLYKLILWGQIAGTILIVVGFIFFILIMAGILRV